MKRERVKHMVQEEESEEKGSKTKFKKGKWREGTKMMFKKWNVKRREQR